MRITKNTNYRRFLASFLLVMLIPLLTTGYFYGRVADILERNALDANFFKLFNFRDLLDGRIEQIDRNISEIEKNITLGRLLNLDDISQNTPEMYWFHEFYFRFNNYALYNNADDTLCFLFVNKSRTVFGYQYLEFGYDEFYDTYFSYDDLAYEQWNALFFQKGYYAHYLPQASITINGRTGEYLTYLYSLPIAQRASSSLREKAVMAYLINVDQINDLISNTLSDNGGATYILDKQMQVLASSDGTMPVLEYLSFELDSAQGSFHTVVDGQEMLALYVHSSYAPLTFLTFLPVDALYSEITQVRNIVVAVALAAMALGVAISVFLSYWNTKPIMALLSTNHTLQKNVEDQRKSLRVLYIDRLLKNSFDNLEEIQTVLLHIGLDFAQRPIATVVIRLLPSSEMISEDLWMERDVYRAAIEESIGTNGYVHILSHNELALVLCAESDQEMDRMIHMLETSFSARFGFTPLFAIGNTYTNVADLHKSYSQAQYAANYASYPSKSDSILRYRDLPPPSDQYAYTPAVEQTLVNLTRQGKVEELRNYLDELFINAAYHNMNATMKRIYLHEMHATLIKLLEEIKLPIDLGTVNEKAGASKKNEYFEALIDAYNELCGEIKKNKKSHNHALVEDITGYIAGNFANSELCVTQLAEAFNLSETYFSQFFKEQLGQTFSHYLEKMRIDHACKMLEQGSHTVEDIAFASGYGNANTFRRAFKRVTGLAPSAYAQYHG